MKFEELNKEQKQKVVLVIMGAAALLYVLYQFVVMPGISRMGKAKDELEILQAEMEKIGHALSSGTRLRTDLEKSVEDLKISSTRYIVPADNPLAWAIERVYECADPLQVEIESVSPLMSTVPWERSAAAARLFNPYTVKVVTRCGYFTLTELIRLLETSNPYVCVSDLRIKGTTDLMKHDVEFMLSWPKWADEKSGEKIRGLDGKPVLGSSAGI
ncbi:MAG TPA: hypothetical protein PKM67_07510 [Kiritimatiellia bacterium]|nr:hypothetical protein [Kiritimatiellia bacterium]HNR94254.1 hypothetical protein [Kiritimatiellia bacterium]HNS81288.1 hypothetical protein [Kiritimatiellia bacterium]HPA78735.1 hypothetical protein [Kiritimatiellia bacterium]HQQ04867.1 hypothetical protein [Kiritimatiellia bacterium]